MIFSFGNNTPGIPFALPPTGPRRFLRPQPAEPWEEVRDASQQAAVVCPQLVGETVVGKPLLEVRHSDTATLQGRRTAST